MTKPLSPTTSTVAVEIIKAIEQALTYASERRANKPMRFIERLHAHGFTIVPTPTGPETKA